MAEVKLAWVLHDGDIVHVSTFVHMLPKDRPHVRCPECGDRLIPHLGSKRTAHAAHASSSTCSLTQPESALHYNMKMGLAATLRGLTSVTIREPCAGHAGARGGCLGARDRVWRSGWTSVEVEKKVFTRQPDILLRAGAETIGAVEVWVSHRVEADKQDEYAAWRVAWIEVAGDWRLIQGDATWTGQSPLLAAKVGPEAAYVCPHCQAHAIWADARARAFEANREAEAERRQKEEADEARRAMELAKLAAEEATRGAAAAEAARAARATFAKAAQTMQSRLRNDGVIFERIRSHDKVPLGGRYTRDAIVLASVYRQGTRVSAFAGQWSDLHVIAAAEADGHGKVNFESLRDAADEWLKGQVGPGTKIDRAENWFALRRILDDGTFVNRWHAEGHVFRRRVPTPSLWRSGAGADDAVDCLDLTNFFLGRYICGWPMRIRWSRWEMRWEATSFANEVRRYWPDSDRRA